MSEVIVGWDKKEFKECILENRKSNLKVSDAANFGDYNFYTSGESVLKHDQTLIDGANIYLATGGIANVKFENGPAAYSTDTYSLKSKEDVDTKYLYYFLLSNLQYINDNFFQGSGLKHLQKKDLKKFLVNLPEDINEQKKIVEILTKVDKAIENTEALIQKFERIKVGIMQDLLTKGIDENGNIRSEETHLFKDSPLGRIPVEWNTGALGNISLLKSGATPNRSNVYFWNGNIPWIKTGEINYNIINNVEETISFEGLIKSSCFVIPKDTLIMAMYGQGKTRARVAITGIESTCNQASVAFLELKRVEMKLLFYILTNNYSNLRDMSNDGAQNNLSSTLLNKFIISFPKNKLEQDQIIQHLTRIDNIIQKNIKILNKLELQKQGLMQDLLSGKIRVNY